MSMLNELIQIAERYDKEYSLKIRGATPEEIRYLEKFVGRPIPVCYQEFLTLMGNDTGTLQAAGIQFNIDQVISFNPGVNGRHGMVISCLAFKKKILVSIITWIARMRKQ